MAGMLRAMARGVALFLVGSLVLVALLGCGRWFEQRDPWRHDAEVECLQSGAVREGPAVTPMSPIAGPGVCGADFPLKVAALGAGAAVGFADEPRPPGAIPGSRMRCSPRRSAGSGSRSSRSSRSRPIRAAP